MTDAQLKFILRFEIYTGELNKVNKNKIQRQLLQDFEIFARRMRLNCDMFYGHNRNVHRFYVKSNCNPPVQKSVALESYLYELKLLLTEIQITKPKLNLSREEQKEKKNELKQNNDIDLKKAAGQGQYHCSHEKNCWNKGGRKPP